MSRLARALEILEAVNAYFQEGGEAVYADALLLGDDVRIKDAIAECVGSEEESQPIVPRNQRKSYGQNALGNWVGFVGKRRMRIFGLGQEGEEKAIRWVNET